MSPLGAIPPREPAPDGECGLLTKAPFFIGWRVVLHCSLDQDYTSGNLREGAVCPPRAPPECFSWFCFGFANGPRHPRFCHSSPIGPRRGPLGPDAGQLPTP